jgi:L-ascorbate metabolism protein UlaG (beta-lactamase superfamily)
MDVSLIGQSTLLINMSGVLMMTDPWWGQWENIRAVPLAMDPDKLEKLDLMLVSHNHIDHWSDPAIRLAGKLGCQVVGSKKAMERGRKKGLAKLTALSPGEKYKFRDITILAVPAVHPFAPDAIGFVVSGEKAFYFSGDSRYKLSIKQGLEGISLDVAFLQVAASTYPFVGRDGMDLPEAASFVREMKPKVVVPMHYQVKGKVLEPAALRKWQIPAKLVVLEPSTTCVS